MERVTLYTPTDSNLGYWQWLEVGYSCGQGKAPIAPCWLPANQYSCFPYILPLLGFQ